MWSIVKPPAEAGNVFNDCKMFACILLRLMVYWWKDVAHLIAGCLPGITQIAHYVQASVWKHDHHNENVFCAKLKKHTVSKKHSPFTKSFPLRAFLTYFIIQFIWILQMQKTVLPFLHWTMIWSIYHGWIPELFNAFWLHFVHLRCRCSPQFHSHHVCPSVVFGGPRRLHGHGIATPFVCGAAYLFSWLIW